MDRHAPACPAASHTDRTYLIFYPSLVALLVRVAAGVQRSPWAMLPRTIRAVSRSRVTYYATRRLNTNSRLCGTDAHVMAGKYYSECLLRLISCPDPALVMKDTIDDNSLFFPLTRTHGKISFTARRGSSGSPRDTVRADQLHARRGRRPPEHVAPVCVPAIRGHRLAPRPQARYRAVQHDCQSLYVPLAILLPPLGHPLAPPHRSTALLCGEGRPHPS
jgi:hypothetical protein